MKIMLFSDLLLDRLYRWASEEQAEQRRQAARDVLVDILKHSRARSVDLLACAGGLFDRDTVMPRTVRWMMSALADLDIPVVLAPGDSDAIGPRTPYTQYSWPDNVRIFDEGSFSPFSLTDGVTIWGAAHLSSVPDPAFFRRGSVDRGGVNIALFHGAELKGQSREPELDQTASFSEEQIRSVGFNHALVGHYQNNHLGLLHAYAGSPLAHDFSGPHEPGVLVITVDDNGVTDREFVHLEGAPPLRELSLDVTGAQSEEEVASLLRQKIGSLDGIVRVLLRGVVPLEVTLHSRRLSKVVPDIVALLDADDVVVDDPSSSEEEEQSIRGQFVREVMQSDLPDDRRSRVLMLGLRALSEIEELEVV